MSDYDLCFVLLNDGGASHTAADAQSRKAALCAAPDHLVKQGNKNTAS